MKMGISSLNNTTNNLVRTTQTPCLSLYHCFKTRQVDSWANHAYWELTHYLAEYANVKHKLLLLLLVASLIHKMYVSDWFSVKKTLNSMVWEEPEFKSPCVTLIFSKNPLFIAKLFCVFYFIFFSPSITYNVLSRWHHQKKHLWNFGKIFFFVTFFNSKLIKIWQSM